MSIREEVSGGVADALAPVAENFLNTLAKLIGVSKDSPLTARLSGKKLHFELDITIPDLTKDEKITSGSS